MSKLYFKYGAMGCSKTASALMCKFNYEQQGYNVFLIKSLLDDRDINNNKIVVKSRIGLYSDCFTFDKKQNLITFFHKHSKNIPYNVIIVDECQFLTEEQVDQLKILSLKIPVLCYGLLTDFKTKLFDGSKRLVEISDSIQEIKSICKCGKKATVNARFVNNTLCTEGDIVSIESDNVSYVPMCYKCFLRHKHLNKE